PGQVSRTVTVDVPGDTIDEDDETFFVNLADPTNATLADGQGLGTIVDNDPVPSLTVADSAVTEGNSGPVVLPFIVTLSASSGHTVTVSYVTGAAGDTASAGVDYTSASGTLTLAPGETSKTIAVSVLGDLVDEPDESFTLRLSNPGNATL